MIDVPRPGPASGNARLRSFLFPKMTPWPLVPGCAEADRLRQFSMVEEAGVEEIPNPPGP